MATNSPGAGREVVSASIPTALAAKIAARAARLSMSKSKFAGMIFRDWEARGYPAVTEADAAMMELDNIPRKATG